MAVYTHTHAHTHTYTHTHTHTHIYIYTHTNTCLVYSTLTDHVQGGLLQFSKSCLNLCSLRWLKPNLNLVSNLRLEE